LVAKRPTCRKEGAEKAERPGDKDVYTGAEAAKKLGVSRMAISKWIRAGLLEVEEERPGGKCKIHLTEEDIVRLGGSWDRDREWTLREAAKFLEMGEDDVYNLVRSKALQARRASVGRRHLWLIPAEEARRRKERMK
jgi:transposase